MPCTLTASVTGPASPLSGGGPSDPSGTSLSVLWQVSAELRGRNLPLNDGISLVDHPIQGVVTVVPVFLNGFLIGYQDTATYTITVPFYDQLLKGAVPVAAPYDSFYLITETYITNLSFGTLLTVGQPVGAAPFTVTRKVRPLAVGGATQTVDSCLV